MDLGLGGARALVGGGSGGLGGAIAAALVEVGGGAAQSAFARADQPSPIGDFDPLGGHVDEQIGEVLTVKLDLTEFDPVVVAPLAGCHSAQ